MKTKKVKFVSTKGLADTFKLDELEKSKVPALIMLASELKTNTDALNFVKAYPEFKELPERELKALYLESFYNDKWELVSADIPGNMFLFVREEEVKTGQPQDTKGDN